WVAPSTTAAGVARPTAKTDSACASLAGIVSGRPRSLAGRSSLPRSAALGWTCSRTSRAPDLGAASEGVSVSETAGPTSDHTGHRTAMPSSPGLIIGVMVVAAFVMILNETIVSIALPHLAEEMDVDTTTVQWLISGFLVTMAVVIPTTGFLLERFTPRQVFLVALSSFAGGTLLSAVALGFPALLIGRMVQACGTAVMIPLVM